MAKIVAIANQKGGVGKTTTAVNLSSCVAALGKRVLIVDLDPQGNTTTGYGIPKRSVEKGTYEILIGEARASEAIRKTEYRTDVIGSNTRLAGASLEMIDLPGRESRLRKALAEHPNVLIRIPLIGGFNDAPADAERFAAFFEPLNTSRVRFEFLSYHEYGKDKWAQCGLPYRMERMKSAFVGDATVAQFKSVFEAAGLHVIHT